MERLKTREENEQVVEDSKATQEPTEQHGVSSERESTSVSRLTMVRNGGSLLVVSRDQLAGLLQGAGG